MTLSGSDELLRVIYQEQHTESPKWTAQRFGLTEEQLLDYTLNLLKRGLIAGKPYVDGIDQIQGPAKANLLAAKITERGKQHAQQLLRK